MKETLGVYRSPQNSEIEKQMSFCISFYSWHFIALGNRGSGNSMAPKSQVRKQHSITENSSLFKTLVILNNVTE